MPTQKITTDRQVASLRPQDRPYERTIGDARGLIVRVFPSGSKAFEFRYVALNGARRRMPLGPYPGLALGKARDMAQRLRVAVVAGADPAGDRVAARDAARTGETLDDLAEAYFAAAAKGLHGGRGRPKRGSTIAVERKRFDLHIAPRLGKKRFIELKRADIKAFMRELASSGVLAPDTVASIGSTLSGILAFAVHEEQLEANPAAGLTRPLALRSRERLISDHTLGALWRALEAVPEISYADHRRAKREAAGSATGQQRASADAVMALAIRFALLTLARRADVALAERTEIDWIARTWTIPSSRFKNGRPHVVPLSDAALEVLTAALAIAPESSPYLFPSPRDAERALDPHSITRAVTRTLHDLGAPTGSPHDFRRSGATTLTGERYGFRRFIVGKVLGHSAHDGAAVTSVYDRNEYLSDKRAALEAWARHLLELASGQPTADNVVSFGRAGAE